MWISPSPSQARTGSPVTDLAQLRADTSYAVSVTVSPKTEPQADSSGTPAAKQSGSATGKVNVFKPTLTYEDGHRLLRRHLR